MSVANIWKHSGEFPRCARWLRNFAAWRTPFRSQRLILQPAKLAFNLEWLASNGANSFISTPNCASFETTYSMYNLGSRKSSKSGWQLLSFWMLHVRFLFASPPCIPDLLMAKDYKASKLWLFMFLSFPLLCYGFQRTLLNLGLLWWSNY